MRYRRKPIDVTPYRQNRADAVGNQVAGFLLRRLDDLYWSAWVTTEEFERDYEPLPEASRTEEATEPAQKGADTEGGKA